MATVGRALAPNSDPGTGWGAGSWGSEASWWAHKTGW